MSTQLKLQQIFQDQFDDDTLEIGPDSNAENIAGWDSLKHVRLMVAIENAFDIRFSVAEVSDLENVGALVQLIESKKFG